MKNKYIFKKSIKYLAVGFLFIPMSFTSNKLITEQVTEIFEIKKHTNTNVENYNASNPFVLKQIVISKDSLAPGFDMNESKGLIAPEHGNRNYGKVLNDFRHLRSANNGWYNEDADSYWYARRVSLQYGRLYSEDNLGDDKVDLYFNVARDTNGTNEDYAFVALLKNPNHSLTQTWVNHLDKDKNVKNTMVNIPTMNTSNGKEIILNFWDMKIWGSYNGVKLNDAAIIDVYQNIISGHHIDAGADNNQGNFLAGIPGTTDGYANLYNTEGTRTLQNVSKLVNNYVLWKLNN